MIKELDKILNADEQVLWEGGPSFWPFWFSRTLPLTIFAIFWDMFLLFFFFMSSTGPGLFKYIIFFTPHFWIGLAMLFGPGIYNALVFKHTYYAITSKRVIIQKGLLARNFQTIDFDKITNTEVAAGIFDQMFGGNSGSIVITGSNRAYLLSNVMKPYDVYKFFAKVQYDVKTDIEYPNQLRPSENPGYKTSYTPEKK